MNSSTNLCILENEHQYSQTHTQTKWAVKLIVNENKVLSKKDFLDFISLYIRPDSIRALVFDTYYNFHVLFLDNAEDFCILIGMTIKTEAFVINFLPLLDFFVIDNVYPCISDDELRSIFETFGPVFHVNNYLALPDSSKFSHVLSGRREVSFLLAKSKTEVFIPVNVFRPPYRFRVQKFCPACVSEGHRVMDCPNIKEIKINQMQAMEVEVEGGKVLQELETISEVGSSTTIISESNSLPSPLKSSQNSENKLPDSTSLDKNEKNPNKEMPMLFVEDSVVEDKTKSVVISQTEISTFTSEDSFLMGSESSLTSTSPVRKRKRLKKKTKQDRKLSSKSLGCIHENVVPQIRSNEHSMNLRSLEAIDEPVDKTEELSVEVKEWLSLSTGVLPPNLIEEILLANVWTPSTISHSISRYSTDLQLVIKQLDKLLSECMNGTSFYHLYPKLVLFKKVVKKLQNN